MKNLLIGSVVALGTLLLTFRMMGGYPILFFHPPELLAVWFAPMGIVVSSYGFKRFSRTVLCVFCLAKPTASDRAVLKRWISATYAVGALSFLSGVILTFCVWDQGPMVVVGKFSAAICALVAAIVLAEVFIRSALSRIEAASD